MPPSPPVEREAPEAWATCDALSFEAAVDELAAAGDLRWSRGARDEYAKALAQADLSSVRAAVLLALDPGGETTEVLLARLETRSRAGSRGRNGGDIVAATALEGRMDAGGRERLHALVEGGGAHPDLEVRVECARTLLAVGDERAIPFLFRVLRVQTPDQHLDPPDWEPVTTLFWAKYRAAEVLSARAGVPVSFLPDASYADQAREASRLAEALGFTPPRAR